MAIYRHKRISLNTETYSMYYLGKEIILSPIEFIIMEMLFDNIGRRPITRQEIVDKCEHQPVSLRAVDNHINRIRSLLRIHYKRGDFIITIRGKGYMLSTW